MVPAELPEALLSQDGRAISITSARISAKVFITNWNAGQDNKYAMPLGLSMTAEESDAVNSRITDIRTYVTENAGKFITGDRPLSDWDAFQEEIHRLGIDECIAAYQTAADRYYAR